LDEGRLETIGKAVSLILITLFGAGSAVVHILEYTDSKVIDQTDQNSSYSAKPDIEVQSYRKELRKSISLEAPKNKATSSTKQKSIWSETYNTDQLLFDSKIRPEIVDLSKNSSFQQLNSEMKYWYKQYNILIKNANNKQAAKDAYNKYRIYKEALKIKRAYN
jgi:hypothetical protein